MTQAVDTSPAESVEHFAKRFEQIREQVSRYIVGQRQTIDHVLIAIICGGHVLLEGVPGLGKTALVHAIAHALDLRFRRVQFTPDLLPADIVGSNIITERDGAKSFAFQPGPVFCNILLADEINRATPKTQSALLETMQEKAVTVAGQTHRLDEPFFVLATQNPIEQDGTYRLPEAQLDRFFFKLHLELPDHDELALILERTGGLDLPRVEQAATGQDILAMGRTLRQVAIEQRVQDHLIHLVRRTHPTSGQAPEVVRKYVRHGASPRAAQTLLAAARARALLEGRFHVARADIDALALPALRHRLIFSFEGEAEGITAERIVSQVIETLA
ncbi:MAG: MoxR family ATPase [Phycisphaeraceae bacterium]